jgi:hypothetical protein
MRKVLSAIPILLCLLGLALPAWGESLGAPAAPSSPAGGFCSAAASSGLASLPDLIPSPELRTGTCGPCRDCFGSSPNDSCIDSNGDLGTCFGLKEGNKPRLCPGTPLYECVCLAISN